MRLRRLAFPAAVLITAAICASPAHAATGTTVQSAWWNEAAIGPLAIPTTTPSDQLQVSNGLAGPLSFAAVRITPASGTPATDTATLTLTIPSSGGFGTPVVSACVTTSSWKPGANQTASAAPGYTCKGGFAVSGSISGSSESWTVPVSWSSDGSISLALVPTPGTTMPFSATYDQPTAASVHFVAPAPAGSGTVVAEPSPFVTPPVPAGGVSALPAQSAPPAASGSAVSAPPAGPSLGALSSGSSSGSGTPVGAPASAAPGGGSTPVSSPSRVPRLVAFILLIFVGLALFGLAGQPDRAPRLVGPLGDRLLTRGRAGMPATAGAAVALAARDAAPMGGGVRLRAHRQARMARTRGEQLSVAVGPFEERLAPVRGIGRFARPRVGPPRRI